MAEERDKNKNSMWSGLNEGRGAQVTGVLTLHWFSVWRLTRNHHRLHHHHHHQPAWKTANRPEWKKGDGNLLQVTWVGKNNLNDFPALNYHPTPSLIRLWLCSVYIVIVNGLRRGLNLFHHPGMAEHPSRLWHRQDQHWNWEKRKGGRNMLQQATRNNAYYNKRTRGESWGRGTN